jgi:GTP-binding protein HflX
MLILDIFAQRATTKEGKLQVALAQYKYRLPRLAGMGVALSRLGGGIGTRGPGETKLETDRRYIKERIAELNREAQDIRTHRELLRTQRSKKGTPVISLVGYTNAGKSTILNYLSDAGVLAENKLFATLDTTTRKVELPNGSEIFLTDTVGFIQKLPHHLVQAFRATLEELQYADILLHVVDASNPNRAEHMKVVYETLKSLGCENTPVITVFNKMDNDVELPLPMDTMARDIVQVSAWKGDGMDVLLERVEKLLQSFRKSMTALVPYTEGSLIGWVHGRSEIIKEEHTAEGVLLEVYVDEESANRLAKFKVEE